MGSNEATSETHANRQWEIHTASIRSIQHPAEGLLSRFFGLALQSQGIAAAVKIKFSELRASEELRDEQVQQLKLNAQEAYDNGLISHTNRRRWRSVERRPTQRAPRASAGTIPSDLAIAETR